jgi:diamine N-acetyltransferase
MMTGEDLQLVEITAETLMPVLRVAVAADQRAFVAENAISIAQAHFEPGAWFRAIALGDEPVGFAMLHDPTLPGAGPAYECDPDTVMLWRFMIGEPFQRQGFGRRAIGLLTGHVRSRPGITRFATSWVPGPGNPGPFYRGLGFVETGRVVDDEIEAVIAL